MPFDRHVSAESSEPFGHRATPTSRAQSGNLQGIVHFAGRLLARHRADPVVLTQSERRAALTRTRRQMTTTLPAHRNERVWVRLARRASRPATRRAVPCRPSSMPRGARRRLPEWDPRPACAHAAPRTRWRGSRRIERASTLVAMANGGARSSSNGNATSPRPPTTSARSGGQYGPTVSSWKRRIAASNAASPRRHGPYVHAAITPRGASTRRASAKKRGRSNQCSACATVTSATAPPAIAARSAVITA